MTTEQRSNLTAVILPFVIFTGIWGSTWIVIRDQLGSVPPQWSVTYRFIIAAAAMAVVARVKGEKLPLDGGALKAMLFLGVAQFFLNFNAVYLAERHITSGSGGDRIRAAGDPQHPARLGIPWPAAERTVRLGLARRRRRDRRCCSCMNCKSIPGAPTRS